MENVLINYFIQINGTRQNEDSPRQGEVALPSFQSHIPEEITFSEQTFLGLASADLCHVSPGPHLSAPQQAEPTGDFCKQIGKKHCLTSVSHLQKLLPHLLAGLHRAAAARWDGTQRLLPPTAS